MKQLNANKCTDAGVKYVARKTKSHDWTQSIGSYISLILEVRAMNSHLCIWNAYG